MPLFVGTSLGHRDVTAVIGERGIRHERPSVRGEPVSMPALRMPPIVVLGE